MSFLAILLWSTLGWAEVAPPACAFHQTVQNTLLFKQVQVVRRNENVGLLVEQDIKLIEWIRVSDNATLGIDKEGRVLSVLKLSDRTVAKPLSGHREFRHLILAADGALIAINKGGEVFRYIHPLWAQSPVKSVSKLALRLFGATSCVTMAGTLLISWWWRDPNIGLSANELLMPLGLSLSMSSFSTAFFALWQYEGSNDLPDGFVRVGDVGKNARITDFTVSAEGWVSDYEVKSDLGKISLQQSLFGVDLRDEHHFDVRCEDELLARGVSESNYSYRW